MPAFTAIYFSLIFDRIGSEAIVDNIISEARNRQREADLPLAPARIDRTTSADGSGGTTEESGGDDR